MKKRDTRYCCPGCGSDDIDAEGWIDVNDDIVSSWSDGANLFCNSCQEHFNGACEIDLATMRCIVHGEGGDHDSTVKPAFTRESADVVSVRHARYLLEKARDLLVKAGAPKAAQRVRLSLSSVRGALSNARARLERKARGEPRKRIRRAPKVIVSTVR